MLLLCDHYSGLIFGWPSPIKQNRISAVGLGFGQFIRAKTLNHRAARDGPDRPPRRQNPNPAPGMRRLRGWGLAIGQSKNVVRVKRHFLSGVFLDSLDASASTAS